MLRFIFARLGRLAARAAGPCPNAPCNGFCSTALVWHAMTAGERGRTFPVDNFR